MADTTFPYLLPGPAVFYGLRHRFRHLMEQARQDGRDWYVIDNSYFDSVREVQFRVTKNAMQHTGLGETDGKRFAALGIEIKQMREGRTVVIAAQSQEFMDLVGDSGWLDRMRISYPGAIVRTKQETRPLLEDLRDAGLLVTWSSAAAVTALLEGVPVACAPQCCATHAVDRKQWAGVLADNQFTESELQDGTAWRAMH